MRPETYLFGETLITSKVSTRSFEFGLEILQISKIELLLHVSWMPEDSGCLSSQNSYFISINGYNKWDSIWNVFANKLETLCHMCGAHPLHTKPWLMTRKYVCAIQSTDCKTLQLQENLWVEKKKKKKKIFHLMWYTQDDTRYISPLVVTLDTYSCMDPGIPVNGIRLSHDLSIGSTVSFQCDTGYRLSHDEPLVCEKNHFWSHSLPTCDGKCTSSVQDGFLQKVSR